MKKKWILSIEKDYEELVKSKLFKMKIEIIHELMEIGVFTVQCTLDEMEKIKKITGVLAIEPEGEVHL